MASFDGLRSLQISSEELSQFECSPCAYDGTKKEALFFCAECGDYLCQSCELSHKKFSSTRKHGVVSGDLLPRIVDIPIRKDGIGSPACSCIRNEATFYCKDHDDVTCEHCCAIKHRKCTTVPICEASAEFEVKTVDNTFKSILELKDKLLKLKMNRTKNASDLLEMTEACRSEIHSFKAELVSEISKMEENTLIELDQHSGTQQAPIVKHINTCNSAINQIDVESQPLEAAKNLNNRRLMFVYNLKLVKLKEHLQEFVEDVITEAHAPSIKFNKTLTLKQPEIRHLGTFGVAAFEKTVSDMNIVSKSQVSVKHPSDKETIPYISGSVFLSSGELILADFVNSKIKMLTTDFTFKECIGLTSNPWDMAIFDDAEVLTTLPNEGKIAFIRVHPNLELGRIFCLEKGCRGIDVKDGCIYVSFDKGEIRVLDFNGRKLKTVCQNKDGTFPFSNLYYISVTTSGKILAIEDTSPAVVNCLFSDGNSVFRLEDSEMKGGRGVFLDAGENVLVCGRKSHNVEIIDKNGKKVKRFLSKTDGLHWPNCIAFRHRDNCLIVGGNTENILVYKLE